MTKRRDKGSGTVYHDTGRNVWVGQVSLGRDGSGRRQRRRVTGRTKTEAKARLRDMIREAENGPLAPARLTVADLLNKWYAAQIERSPLAEPTRAAYRRTAQLHITPSVGAIRVKDLTCDHVDAMLTDLIASGYARAEAVKARQILARALRWGERRDLATRNVAALCEVPDGPVKQRRSLTADEARRLLAALDGDRYEAFFTVGLLLGLRPGEIAALPWGAVDFDAGTLTVKQSLRRQSTGELVIVEPKTAAGFRCLALPQRVMCALRDHRKAQIAERLTVGGTWRNSDDLVFTTEAGSPLDPSNVRRELKRLCAEAGVERISPHELRHSAASLLLDAGVPIQHVADLLGHATLRMTSETYRHRVVDVVPAAVVPMGALFGGS